MNKSIIPSMVILSILSLAFVFALIARSLLG